MKHILKKSSLSVFAVVFLFIGSVSCGTNGDSGSKDIEFQAPPQPQIVNAQLEAK